MKTNATNALRIFPGFLALMLMAGLTFAQQPSPSPKKAGEPKTESVTEAGEDAGDYMVTSSLEFGYRGLSVDGDRNKYQSDLNYRTGPRLFDSSFLKTSLMPPGSAVTLSRNLLLASRMTSTWM